MNLINYLKYIVFMMLSLTLCAAAHGEDKNAKTTPKTEKTSVAAECSELFKETEKIISEAAQQPGIHKQVQKIKSNYASSKAELLKLDASFQEKSCKKALQSLEKLKQRY